MNIINHHANRVNGGTRAHPIVTPTIRQNIRRLLGHSEIAVVIGIKHAMTYKAIKDTASSMIQICTKAMNASDTMITAIGTLMISHKLLNLMYFENSHGLIELL